MILHFSINYHTEPGQEVYVTGTMDELGGGFVSRTAAMYLSEGFNWKKDITLDIDEDLTFEYRYYIKGEDGFSFYEAGYPRKITLTGGENEVWLNDQWQGYTHQAPLLTSVFSEVLFPHGVHSPSVMHRFGREVVIRVTVPAVPAGDAVYLCGDAPSLGNWNPSEAVEMHPVQGSRWEAHFDAGELPPAVSFKFIRCHIGRRVSVVWESGDNRSLSIPSLKDGDTFSVEYAAAAFTDVYPRIKGTAIPVFSLRSEESEGIGDFADIRYISDWAERTGQHIIQLLPINDTTATHSSMDAFPYSSISDMALYPLYLNLGKLGKLKDPVAAASFEKERKELNALPAVDYDRVIKFKEKYTALYFAQMGKETLESADYKAFFTDNKVWLLSYSLFCAFRDKFGTADFSKWGEYSKYEKSFISEIDSFGEDIRKAVDLSCFIQYHLDRQLRESVDYAHKKGVALKGDIPIGIMPFSVCAWKLPHLFHLDSNAGTPPDMFSQDGQNWGFPTYDWEAMGKDAFRWWKTRFSKMGDYFDAYRIDHVLGFFRIWEIPKQVRSGALGHFAPALPMSPEEIRKYGLNFDPKLHGITCAAISRVGSKSAEESLKRKALFLEDPRQKGMWHPAISGKSTETYAALEERQRWAFDTLYYDFFYKRHNDFWKRTTYTKLSELLASSRMLTCAEDLGMIPDCVPEVMESLRILTLEIQRMPKQWGYRFSDPSRHPYLSVGSTGSHDISPLRRWWEEDRDGASDYWWHILKKWGDVPEHLDPDTCTEIVRQNLNSSSMLTIIPLQDYLAMDSRLCSGDAASERINDPSNSKNPWKYRMPVTLEQLCRETEFNEKLFSLIRG